MSYCLSRVVIGLSVAWVIGFYLFKQVGSPEMQGFLIAIVSTSFLAPVVGLIVWSGGLPGWYRTKTAIKGVKGLLTLPQEDVDKCIKAYQYFQAGTNNSDTEEETEHVRAYYTVINEVLCIADTEKMYIPPQIDPSVGLFANQIKWEKRVCAELNATGPETHLLDIGCGRGRIAHHFATETGGKVSGFNIDEAQINNAKEYANETNMQNRLDFKVGDHHKPFQYADNSFDGAYSFQALWPFLKVDELLPVCKELFRVLKPGAWYVCSEYLHSPAFDWNIKEHAELYRLYLPTLAATQSNYPADVCAALKKAGFEVELSTPSPAPAWPLCDQKTQLFLVMRSFIVFLTKVGMSPVWVETLVNNLLLGGQAWTKAERMKIADLNWRIIVKKPVCKTQGLFFT